MGDPTRVRLTANDLYMISYHTRALATVFRLLEPLVSSFTHILGWVWHLSH